MSFVLSAHAQEIKIGATVPDFKLWMLDGTRITQNDIAHKVAVFKFWFTTCMPCVIGIPKLNTLPKEFANRKDILFIAPALERKPVLEMFLKHQPFGFKIAYSAMNVSRMFNKKQVYPSYFVIDKKGKIIYR